MNWTPVFYAWGFFVFTTILALIGIQVRSRRQPAFRSGARSLVLLLGLSLCLFAVIAEYFHISIWWAPLVLPVIGMLGAFFFLSISSAKRKRTRNI